MDAILMSGGKGTRLFPLTKITNKHLLPVANKPMIYYSLSVLLLSGASRIFLVTTPDAVSEFEKLLAPLLNLGLRVQIIEQKTPLGITDGIRLCASHIQSKEYLVMLGDNFFYGPNLTAKLRKFVSQTKACSVICYEVKDPSQLGVAHMIDDKIIDIIEKPKKFVGNNAITGLYKFDHKSFDYASRINFSSRGELEISDVLKAYLIHDEVSHTTLGRGFTWFDLGTFDDLNAANNFVRTIEKYQGFFIGCIEEILLRTGYINKADFKEYSNNLPDSPYKEYLLNLSPQIDNFI